jgi:hypothetical protein
MVAAYSTFANEGVYRKPQFISKLKIKVVVIYEPIPESHDVLNKDIAYAVIKLLEGVTEGGSGDRLRTTGGGGNDNRWTGYPYSLEINRKNRYHQNQSDGWFMGMVLICNRSLGRLRGPFCPFQEHYLRTRCDCCTTSLGIFHEIMLRRSCSKSIQRTI